MANTLEYIFSLQDKMSAKIGNITVTSDRMLGRFAELERRTQSVSRTFNETGRTMGALREKIALLQAEREWIPAENIEGIRAYNREMNRLNREITQLESLNGGKFKKWGKEAFAAMPGSNLISNPLVAGTAAVGFSAKSAMNFDEGMAKVNITAQLDKKGLTDLKTRLKQVVKDNKADIEIAPVGLEKIISQVGDVDLSMQILDASLKGSKAGFTEIDAVSGALAQSLSVIGKENTNAKEVLDTFFAAKRVGAGEFADFARYMPGLIAGASNMGINFKEVAGTFAYMTGKGQSAERAAVLMENAFSVLGKADIRGKMEKAGIKVFDEQGKMRGMVDIFTDLKGVLGGMTDEQKSSILEKFGLTDKEAKNAFALMTSDLGKLQEAMDATANASGETEKAMSFSQNTIMKATEVWNQFKGIANSLGEVVLPVISAALSVASAILSGLCTVVETIGSLFGWWFTQFQEGNPYIWGVTAAIAALSTALMVNYIRTNATILALKAMYAWDVIVAGAKWLWTAAQWALNTALYACPLTWIVLAIGAVVAAVVYCWNEFEGFRQFIMSMWETFKEFGRVLVESIVSPFKQVLKGIDGVCMALVKLVDGDFNGALDSVKNGLKGIGEGIIQASPISVAANVVQKGNWKDAWETGQQKGADPQQNTPVKKTPATMIPGTQLPAPIDNSPEARFGTPDFFGGKSKPVASADSVPATLTAATASTQSYEKLTKSLDGGKKNKKGKGTSGDKTSKTLDLNDNSTVQNLKSSADYTAITRKLAPKKVDLTPVNTTLLADASNVPGKVPDASNKITDARQRFTDSIKKPDETKQEYAPEKSEKSDFLKDIMFNVRKIAAIGAIPLAVNLAAPAPVQAKVPEVKVPEIATPSLQIQQPDIQVPPLTATVPESKPQKTTFPQPQQPELRVPRIPELTAPKMQVPELAPLEATVPELTAPTMQVPEITAPRVAIPPIAVPEMKAPPSPALQMPEMASIATPSSEVYNYESSEKITERSERFDKETTVRDSGKIMRMDKFCDQIVIHIQNTDGKGQETIRQEVMKVINELFEG